MKFLKIQSPVELMLSSPEIGEMSTTLFLSESKLSPNVIYSTELVGGADLELDVYAENRERLHEIINEIKREFPDIVKDHETMQYYSELKHNLFPWKV